MTAIQQAQEQMVAQQVRTWDVLDERVLDILREVPREKFVPAEHRYLAFAEASVPLPHGQHMLRPSIAGRILQALRMTGSERVLEIGTGSGFLTACLAAAAARVTSVEIFSDLATVARANLAEVGVHNAQVETADAMRLPAGPTYEIIVLTGSLPVYDERFEQHLEVGGRLFAVVGTVPVMEARLVRRVSENGWASTSLFETVIDPLINARARTEFIF
jgi:protein-L-isoaspartate(D-aspartate) O-methyltransferase